MALLQYAAPWLQQPQEAVEVRRDVLLPEWVWLGSNPAADLASGRVWTRGSGLTDDLSDFGRGVSAASGAGGFSRSGGRTTAQTRYTYIGVMRRDGVYGYQSLFITSGVNSGISIAADNLGGNFGLIKRGIVAVGSSMSLPLGETVVMVMSHNENTGEYYMLVRPLAGGVVSRVATSNTAKSSAGDGTYKTGRGWDDAFNGSIGLSYLAWEFLPEARAHEILDNPWGFVFAPQSIWVPVSAGGGSPDVTVAATGVAATGSSGTASPATDKAISGQSATASSGTASPSLANALTGNAATSAGGLVSPSVTIALTGVSATTSVGTVSPSSGVTVALTGVEATTGAGTVGPGAVVALSGQQATASVGAVSVASPDVTVALSGVSASASAGSVSASGGASVGGGMGFEMGGGKKRRIVKIRWNGYDYTLDRDALPAFLESIEEQAEEKVTKKRNAKKKPAPLAKIVSAPADVMPDLKERIAAVNRSIGALWGTKDDEEEEEILWLMV